jgi:methionine-rich copper-binding protein CopC
VTVASSSVVGRSTATRRTAGVALVAGALGLGAAGLVALAPAAPAAAHDYVVSSTPAEGSTQADEITEASITFNDVILDLSGTGSSNVLEVTDASGRHFEDGCSTSDGPTLSTGVALGAAGDYTMTYQAVSADGHTVSASLPFSWAPPAGAVVGEGAATRPVCDASDTESGAAGEGTGQATAEPGSGETSATAPVATGAPGEEPTAEGLAQASDPEESNLGLVVGIGVGIVVLALVAVVVVLVTSRRRGDDLAGPAGDVESGEPGVDGADGEAGARDGRG